MCFRYYSSVNGLICLYACLKSYDMCLCVLMFLVGALKPRYNSHGLGNVQKRACLRTENDSYLSRTLVLEPPPNFLFFHNIFHLFDSCNRFDRSWVDHRRSGLAPGRSWGPHGSLFGVLRAALAPFELALGCFSLTLGMFGGPSWAVLGCSWAFVGGQVAASKWQQPSIVTSS